MQLSFLVFGLTKQKEALTDLFDALSLYSTYLSWLARFQFTHNIVILEYSKSWMNYKYKETISIFAFEQFLIFEITKSDFDK